MSRLRLKFFRIIKYLAIFFIAIITLIPAGYFIFDQTTNIEDKALNPTNIGSYIINLDRSRERYDYVKPKITKLGYDVQRVEAVDGSKLLQSEIDQKLDMNSYLNYLNHSPNNGTIGCSLSHIKTWNNFLQSNYEFALIFEDDVDFDPAKLRIIVDGLIENKKYWDIVILEVYHGGAPITIKDLKNQQNLVLYLLPVTHTGAYLINRNAARRLLEKAIPIKMPIDHYYTRTWEFGLKFTGVENPRLVSQAYGDSEINSSKVLLDPKIGFKNVVHKCIYLLQSEIMRLIYNLKIYFELKML